MKLGGVVERWVEYQQERFPVLKYSLLVAAFTTSGLSLSFMLTGRSHSLSVGMFLAAFVVTFLTFFQLRVADEHKDESHDRLYHPSRPVPRGLVSLSELRILGYGSAVVQTFAALTLSPILMVPLVATWVYLVLMTKEFFVGDWLRARPVLYMVSHMCILLFTDFFITACHWMVTEKHPPLELVYFLGMSFFLGLVIEVGRKVRSPGEETAAKDTYTSLWGSRTTVTVWLSSIAASACFAVLAAAQIGSMALSISILSVLFFACCMVGRSFLRTLSSKGAKRIDSLSGAWTLAAYLSIGLVPLLVSTIFS